jgi:hypothetical protein
MCYLRENHDPYLEDLSGLGLCGWIAGGLLGEINRSFGSSLVIHYYQVYIFISLNLKNILS